MANGRRGLAVRLTLLLSSLIALAGGMLIFAAGPLGLLSWLPRLAGQAIVVVALAASSVASVLLAASRDGWSAPRMAGMLGVVLLVACVYVLVIVWSSNGMLGF